MRTAWKGSLLSVVIALAACDQSPAAAPTPPPVRGAPTTAATAGARRHGNVVVASGPDADTLVRHTAARWAAQGRPALQHYVDTSSFWDGRVPGRSARLAPPPPDDGSGYSDLSSLTAQILKQGLEVSVSGNEGLVTLSADYWGTDAHTDLAFGANYAGGATDIPAQTTGANDGHAIQKLECASELMGGSIYQPDCIVWAGTVTASAHLFLSHDCGEFVYGSATTKAWFELPIPTMSWGTGGFNLKFEWKQYGSSGPVAIGRKTAYQPSCPTVVKKTPACSNQIIYDPSGCDGTSDGSIVDPLGGSKSGGCTLYLVQIEESYDGGKTWVVVNSWLETIC